MFLDKLRVSFQAAYVCHVVIKGGKAARHLLSILLGQIAATAARNFTLRGVVLDKPAFWASPFS